ncbi:hypothetical protein CRG98_010353 [Punica granatum]|uniref:Uncharacterized protein n=1 Tax=Punica granatum TaxID=22663 RepID=A0A2I0KLX8_PUNGR|nr:hypothetical protein CRG98_010353 [Punica granatum]
MLGCKGCTFGELGARGMRLECTGDARRARGAGRRAGVQVCARGALACAGRGRARACGRARGAGVRVAGAGGSLFTRE